MMSLIESVPGARHAVAGRHALTILPNILRRLSEPAQRKIRENSYVVPVKKGELIVQTGQIYQGMIIVQSGWLAAEIDDVCVAVLEPNSFFLVNLGDSTRAAACNLRAVSSNTSIAVIDSKTLACIVADSPAVLMLVCEKLLDHLAKYFSETAKRVTQPLEMRLAGFLWNLGMPADDGTRRIPSAIPQQCIASYLGASREEVSRKRQLLIRSGYLSKRDDEWYMESLPGMTLE